MFTRFMDMHSGGRQKEPYARIYIEAPEAEAKVIFYNRFKHNPERVTCTCCGEDYSIYCEESLELATAYDRGCKWNGKSYNLATAQVSLDDYLAKSQDVLVIRAGDIKDSERVGEIPPQGYVWVE